MHLENSPHGKPVRPKLNNSDMMSSLSANWAEGKVSIRSTKGSHIPNIRTLGDDWQPMGGGKGVRCATSVSAPREVVVV